MSDEYVRNNSAIPQCLGHFRVEPGEIKPAPAEVITALRSGSMKELVVLDQNSDNWLFKTTEHLPFSPRYR